MENHARQVGALLVSAALAFGSAWAFTREQPDLKGGLSGVSVMARQDMGRLRSGDLIFRRGRDAVSGMVLALDERLPFSHVGVVEVEGNRAWVIHATPAEGDEKDGRVKREALEVFTDSERAEKIGVFRHPGISSESAARIVVNAKRYLGRPFDAAFDLEHDGQVYCTELAWLAYRGAGVELVTRFDAMKLPLHQGPVILPGSIVDGGGLERVF